MQHWDLTELEVRAHQPTILSSTDQTRAIVVHLPAGDRLQDHQVHERAWLVVVAGRVEVSAADGTQATGGPGLAVELDPQERHEVLALEDARFLLLLAPWPGDGHPGSMSLDEKAHVRQRAAERQGLTSPEGGG